MYLLLFRVAVTLSLHFLSADIIDFDEPVLRIFIQRAFYISQALYVLVYMYLFYRVIQEDCTVRTVAVLKTSAADLLKPFVLVLCAVLIVYSSFFAANLLMTCKVSMNMILKNGKTALCFFHFNSS
jgi:hypothetical protein